MTDNSHQVQSVPPIASYRDQSPSVTWLNDCANSDKNLCWKKYENK